MQNPSIIDPTNPFTILFDSMRYDAHVLHHLLSGHLLRCCIVFEGSATMDHHRNFNVRFLTLLIGLIYCIRVNYQPKILNLQISASRTTTKLETRLWQTLISIGTVKTTPFSQNEFKCTVYFIYQHYLNIDKIALDQIIIYLFPIFQQFFYKVIHYGRTV